MIQYRESGAEAGKLPQRALFIVKIQAMRVEPKGNHARAILLAASALFLISCTGLRYLDQSVTSMHLGNHDLGIAMDVEACRDGFGQSEPDTVAELDGEHISLVSWNVQKNSLSGRPYHIQCPGTAPQTSHEWLT